MKALVKAEAAPGLWLRDVPDPTPGPGEVLIRVLRTGICGTDLHIESWNEWAQATIHPPLVVGHEFVGEVVRLGDGVATAWPAVAHSARTPSASECSATAPSRSSS